MFVSVRAPGLKGQVWKELGFLRFSSVLGRWINDASVERGLQESVAVLQVNQLGGMWRLPRALQIRRQACQADVGKQKGNKVLIVGEVTEDFG